MLRAYYEIKVWDRRGRIIRSTGKRISRSFTERFLLALLSQMRQQALAGMKDILGATRTFSFNAASFGMGLIAGIGVDDLGIVIGTDATGETISDFQLAAQIFEGTGAGQMQHQAVAGPFAPTVSPPDASFTFTRSFNNNSGGAITVRETAIYMRFRSGVSNFSFCGLRDTPASLAVPNGGGASVSYTIQVTV